MAFCANCGADLGAGGSFCPKCGAPAAAGGPGPEAGGAPAPGGLSRNMAGALCYVFGLITGIIFLLWEPYNKDRFIRFHAFQSIFFNVAVLVASTAVSLVPFVGWVVAPLVGLASLAGWVILIIKAYQGASFKLPVLGDIAEKQV